MWFYAGASLSIFVAVLHAVRVLTNIWDNLITPVTIDSILNYYFLWFSLQNLREAIASYRSSILCQADEMKREASLSFFVEYLERYYFLICFAVYLHTERDAIYPVSPDRCSFTEWMRARPELYSILRR